MNIGSLNIDDMLARLRGAVMVPMPPFLRAGEAAVGGLHSTHTAGLCG